MSSNEKKSSSSLGLGKKTALQLASKKLEEEKVPKRPSGKYISRSAAREAKQKKQKKGGYRYSELGMKGLTIAFGDDVSSKKLKNKTRGKKVKGRKPKRKGTRKK